MFKKWREERSLRRSERMLAWYEKTKQLFLTTDNAGVLSNMLFNLPRVYALHTYPVGAMSVGMEVELDDGWSTSINEYAMRKRDCCLVCASRVLSELARKEQINFNWQEEKS